MDCLSASFEKKGDWSRPAVQILALEGAVSAVAGLEEAREMEAHMLEELAHQAVDKGNG